MIINPVMIRKTLNARGAHAAIVSVMMVSPVALIRFVTRHDPGEKHFAATNLRLCAKQYRNNAVGKVFAATAASGRRVNERINTKGRKTIPALV
jgi:hypothetical protein